MIKKLAFAASVLGAFALAGPAHATLIGQTVQLSLGGTISGTPNRTSATVLAGGPEFVIDLFVGRAIEIDVQDSFIDFQYNNFSTADFGTGNFSVTISGLTWAPDPGVVIGATVMEFEDPSDPSSDLGPNTATFTPSSVTLNVNGRWEGLDRVRVDLITSHSQLPEPASLALFGVGLLGLGVAVRCRRYTYRLSPSGLTRGSIHQLARDGERGARLCSRRTPLSVVRTRPIHGSSGQARG